MANADLRFLFQAIQSGAPDSVKSLLTCHTYTSDQLNAALLHTIRIWNVPSHTQCMCLLLEAGGFLRTRDREGRGLLLLAASRGLAKEIEELVAKGCDVQEQDLKRRSALHWAMESEAEDSADTTKTLLRLGANWKLKDQQGNTPLHIAALKGHEDALKALIEAGCRTDVFNNNGDTPLHLAVRSSQDHCLSPLMQLGASPTVLNKLHKTPMSYANPHQMVLIRQFAKKEKPRWNRSRTAPSASLPDAEEEEESLETQLLKERLAREEAEGKEKMLRAELQQVGSQMTQIRETLESELATPAFSYLFPTNQENSALENLFSHLGVDLMRFSVEAEAWQRSSESRFLSLISTIRRDVKSFWPSADIQSFGSFSVALHLPRSGLDLVIVNPPKDTFCLPSLNRYFENCSYAYRVTLVTDGLFATLTVHIDRVKVVISQDSPNHPGQETTRFVKEMLQKTHILRPIALALKHLFQWCDAANPSKGEVSTFALLIMTLSFLQERAGFVDLAESFYALMHYYAWEFTYETPISLRPSDVYLLQSSNPGFISIQDPILPWHDLGAQTQLSVLTVPFTQTCLRLACQHLRFVRSCHCPSSQRVFLHLLQETKFDLYCTSHICQ